MSRTRATAVNVNRATAVNVNRATATTATVAGRRLNNVYAGADGAAYRRSATGWQEHTAEGWRDFVLA